MNIKSEKIILELNNQEARSLAYHIKHSLEESIKSHYICTFHDSYKRGLEGHAKPLFEEQRRKDLNMMKQLMACCDGNGEWMEEELWSTLEREYKAKNGKKESNQ